jgi:hypothetical protein
LTGLCSGASVPSERISSKHRVLDEHGLGEARAAVNDSVRDHGDAVGAERRQHVLERRAVIPDAAGLADALDHPGGDRRLGLDVHEAVLQRGRPAVKDENAHASSAWITVMATVFTMSSTVAPRERSFTGLRSPWRRCVWRSPRGRRLTPWRLATFQHVERCRPVSHVSRIGPQLDFARA